MTATQFDGELTDWRSRSRVMLQPIAPPSVLGLFGFGIATFMVAANLAWGFGGDEYLFPFATAAGGIAQFAAAMWAFRARDAIATAMHGIWGAFWIGFGILWLLFATGALTNPETGGQFPEYAYWFAALAAVTAAGAWAALYENLGLFVTLALLTVGAGLLSAGLFTGGDALETAAGYVLVASALAAWFSATAMMLECAAGHVVLPLGKRGVPLSNKRGASITAPIEFESGQPGVRVGQ
jgi:succinate-acetate transporter protein